MSDIRKFMNIVESVSEDATSPDVGTTDSESSEKMSPAVAEAFETIF